MFRVICHLDTDAFYASVEHRDNVGLRGRPVIVEEPIAEARDIYRLACCLLGRDRLVRRPLRLLGLGVSNLREPTAQQLILLLAESA